MFGQAAHDDRHRLTRGEIGEAGGTVVGARHLHAQQLQSRDGVSVGRGRRVLEDREQAAFDVLAHHVLPAAGLLVDLIPGHSDDVHQEALGEAMLAHHRDGERASAVGQFEVPVPGDPEEAVALHAGNGLRHGGTGLFQTLGDPRPQRHDALFFEIVDRSQVHLGGVNQVVHCAQSLSSPPRLPSSGVVTAISPRPGESPGGGPWRALVSDATSVAAARCVPLA